jgi:hypothetical protein
VKLNENFSVQGYRKENLGLIKTIILDWKKLGTYTDIIKQAKKTTYRFEGVYLWLESTHTTEEKNHCINYVGKAEKSVLDRNLDHIFKYLALMYHIPPYYLAKEFVANDTFTKILLEIGWYQNVRENLDDYLTYLNDFEKYSKVKKCAISYLENLTIYYCKTSDKIARVPIYSTKNIERNLIYQLQPMDNRNGYASPSREPLVFEHSGALSNMEDLFENTRNYLSIASNKRFLNGWGKTAQKIDKRYTAAKESWSLNNAIP